MYTVAVLGDIYKYDSPEHGYYEVIKPKLNDEEFGRVVRKSKYARLYKFQSEAVARDYAICERVDDVSKSIYEKLKQKEA